MRYPKKKSYLVAYFNAEGNEVKTLFTRKISAYRFASITRTALFSQGFEGSAVVTTELSKAEVKALTAPKTETI
jgi:hypothetical protein